MNQKYIRSLAIAIFVLLSLSWVLAQDEIPSVTISANEDGLNLPETISSGWVELSFENNTEISLSSFIGRLNDDATTDDFMAALMGMMGGDMSMTIPATFIGSPMVQPESSQTATYFLEAGTYVFLNVASGEPQLETFLVEGEAAESDFEPEADLTVTLLDFAFNIATELPAGEQTWLIENAGEQWHEMAFIPVPEGTTLEDAMSMLMSAQEPAEAATEETATEGNAGPEIALFWSPMSPEQQAWLHVDLAPGTYLVTCFIPDISSDEHAPHAALGMIQIITVTEAES